MCQEATGKTRAVEKLSPERKLPEPEANRGGRSWGRRTPRGLSSGWAWSGEVEERRRVEGELGAAIYSRPEAVAANGIILAGDYGEAVAEQAA